MKKSWCAALLLGCWLTASAEAGETVKIGVMGPVTGPWAAEGQDMENVVKLLAENINKAGGAKGRQIEIKVGDDAGDPKTAALAAQRLAASGVIAVVGTYGSSITEASQGIYDDEEILQIATGSTSVRLSEKGLPLFFRTCPRDDDQGRVLAAMVMKMGHRKIALIHDNTSYAKGLANEAKAIFDKSEAKIVVFDALTPGDRDYTTTLVKMKAAGPDIIVFTGYFPEAGMLLRQKKDMKWDIPMIGGDATNNAAIVESAGKEAAAGYYFVSPPGPGDLATPEAKQFLAQYQERYKSLPRSVYAMLAGDAFRVMVEALDNMDGKPTSKKMGDYLHNKLKNFEGFTGPISFNAKGDRVGDLYRLYRIDADGKFVMMP